jgi:hypothetical protein
MEKLQNPPRYGFAEGVMRSRDLDTGQADKLASRWKDLGLQTVQLTSFLDDKASSPVRMWKNWTQKEVALLAPRNGRWFSSIIERGIVNKYRLQFTKGVL